MAVDLVQISGTPRERGRQYGEAARDKIDKAVEWYAHSFAQKAGLPWASVTEQTQGWVPLIEAYHPEILDEVRGIAEGANRTFHEILALNGRGEMHNGNPFAASEEECSSFAVLAEASGDGRVYCGQNWDWQCATAETVMMLRIEQPGKPTIIMQVEAGQVGRQGANSAGIALNANGLGPRFGTGLGVPGPFVRRKALDSWNMHDALDAVFHVRQGFSTNILLTHRDGFAIDIETTPGRHHWMYPDDGVLVHGNHFEAFVPEQINDSYKPFAVDSLYRVQRIRQGLRAVRDTTEPAKVRAVIRDTMSDHFGWPESVCNHPNPNKPDTDRYQTVASSLVDLTSGDYWLTSGNPCENGYDLIPVNLYS
ncbi:C45 family autoproteolytic acyltransferase/hydolase [Microtetraspora malaysiensis]|uniref:C45 family autoproteolytic acyltransferase/hydolase n=1 Tax=Microtetraspora malaysiensis TaxID=161358 RepID=UPI00082D427A|nr:C45 family peptidase [Microtetraspora malaysiensis]